MDGARLPCDNGRNHALCLLCMAKEGSDDWQVGREEHLRLEVAHRVGRGGERSARDCRLEVRKSARDIGHSSSRYGAISSARHVSAGICPDRRNVYYSNCNYARVSVTRHAFRSRTLTDESNKSYHPLPDGAVSLVQGLARVIDPFLARAPCLRRPRRRGAAAHRPPRRRHGLAAQMVLRARFVITSGMLTCCPGWTFPTRCTVSSLIPRRKVCSSAASLRLLNKAKTVASLEKLHAKHVLPGFADRTHEEQEIEQYTTDITKVRLSVPWSAHSGQSSLGLPPVPDINSTHRPRFSVPYISPFTDRSPGLQT